MVGASILILQTICLNVLRRAIVLGLIEGQIEMTVPLSICNLSHNSKSVRLEPTCFLVVKFEIPLYIFKYLGFSLGFLKLLWIKARNKRNLKFRPCSNCAKVVHSVVIIFSFLFAFRNSPYILFFSCISKGL